MKSSGFASPPQLPRQVPALIHTDDIRRARELVVFVWCLLISVLCYSNVLHSFAFYLRIMIQVEGDCDLQGAYIYTPPGAIIALHNYCGYFVL